MSVKKTYKFVDLFAGLGGIRIGFQQAAEELGIKTKCVFTSEIKDSALLALNENFPNENIQKKDITKVKSDEIPHFNILLGGFPCQAFSFAGGRKGFSDARGTLFFEIERILNDHINEVDGFILENVEGLITHDKEEKSDKIGKTLKVIMTILSEKLNFNTQFALLNAADYGLPQKRKRVYIVGCKKKYGTLNLDIPKKGKVSTGAFLENGLPCIHTDFTTKLLSHYKADALCGKFLKDKRGGALNIHSWDFEYRGNVSSDQKELMNLLFKFRRRKKWAKIIGIDWMDGMPLTINQIETFYTHPNLQEMLDDLVEKKYLVYEHPKKKVLLISESGRTYTTRVYDTSKEKGYNIVTGKLSFPISSILDKSSQSPTIVAADMDHVGVVDGNGIRKMTLREGLRFFGYPESYSLEIFNSDCKNIQLGYDLLGNTVCVPIIKEISLRLLKKISSKNG
ncbi:MAG: DNA (cytosine-5-)-methyltransferase [Opitutae bacterium]|nr:DNA (cytosine-5-)-methyltransferase [Opitutae bacterium]